MRNTYQIIAVLIAGCFAGAGNGLSLTTGQTVYYRGSYINTRGAVEATSQSAHNISRSIFTNIYRKIIFNPGMYDCFYSIKLWIKLAIVIFSIYICLTYYNMDIGAIIYIAATVGVILFLRKKLKKLDY